MVDKVDEALKADVMYWTAFYERRMRLGNKKIFHLEAWVIKVMSLYKVRSILPIVWWKDTDGFCIQHFFYGIDMSEF